MKYVWCLLRDSTGWVKVVNNDVRKELTSKKKQYSFDIASKCDQNTLRPN